MTATANAARPGRAVTPTWECTTGHIHVSWYEAECCDRDRSGACPDCQHATSSHGPDGCYAQAPTVDGRWTYCICTVTGAQL